MIIPILCYPDKRLRIVAKPVAIVDEVIKTQVSNMFETMYYAKGVGLAATQVDFHQRIIVVDVSDEQNKPICLINPEIIAKSGEIIWSEGCLSVPNYYENVKRANEIKVRALNQDGEEFELDANEFLAICIQHEIDHINGILFVDYISTLKQKRLKHKINKQVKRL